MPTTIRPLSIRSVLIVTAFCVIASAATFASGKGAQGPVPPERSSRNYERWLTREVGHELIQLPWLAQTAVKESKASPK